MLMLSKELAFRLHWQSLRATIDVESAEIERQLASYRLRFEADRLRLSSAIQHIPGDSIEETLVKDYWVRQTLRGKCIDEIEIDVLPAGEELPHAEFEGRIGIGDGKSIECESPVVFQRGEVVRVLGREVVVYSRGVK